MGKVRKGKQKRSFGRLMTAVDCELWTTSAFLYLRATNQTKYMLKSSSRAVSVHCRYGKGTVALWEEVHGIMVLKRLLFFQGDTSLMT